jgi:Uma2 family endonuclease
MSEAEYLEYERKAELRSEYINGGVYSMAGASWRHGQIVLSIGAELRRRLQNSPCRPFLLDLRVRVAQTGMYTYPDLGIVCGPPHFADDQQDTLLNPTVLIEVLSDSTKSYDRGEKFAHYRRIDSLREYLVVDQESPHVEHYTRSGDGSWVLREYDGLGKSLHLPAAGCELFFSAIYEGIDFNDDQNPTRPSGDPPASVDT